MSRPSEKSRGSLVRFLILQPKHQQSHPKKTQTKNTKSTHSPPLSWEFKAATNQKAQENNHDFIQGFIMARYNDSYPFATASYNVTPLKIVGFQYRNLGNSRGPCSGEPCWNLSGVTLVGTHRLHDDPATNQTPHSAFQSPGDELFVTHHILVS